MAAVGATELARNAREISVARGGEIVMAERNCTVAARIVGRGLARLRPGRLRHCGLP